MVKRRHHHRERVSGHGWGWLPWCRVPGQSALAVRVATAVVAAPDGGDYLSTATAKSMCAVQLLAPAERKIMLMLCCRADRFCSQELETRAQCADFFHFIG
jgi:hypothetical protein